MTIKQAVRELALDYHGWTFVFKEKPENVVLYIPPQNWSVAVDMLKSKMPESTFTPGGTVQAKDTNFKLDMRPGNFEDTIINESVTGCRVEMPDCQITFTIER